MPTGWVWISIGWQGNIYTFIEPTMYPSTYRLELRSRRAARRTHLIASHLFVAAVTLLGSLSLFASVVNN